MISIIVPVYNSASTLERCVLALQSQTYTDIQIILIDDGSTDKSKEICDVFAQTDSRIHVIHQENAGVSAARNAGLDHAIGEYIMFCDSDDYPETEWCEKLLRLAECNSRCLPISNYRREKSDASYINYAEQCYKLDSIILLSDMFTLYKLELIGIPWNKIYRRKIIEFNHIRFDERISLGEDLIFVIDYLSYISDGFVFTSEPLYHYKTGNTSSLSMKYYPDLMQTYEIIFGKLKDHLLSVPTAWEQYEKDYRHSYFWAMDRVLYNTFSPENSSGILKKIKYNSKVYKSTEFIISKSWINKKEINVLQYYALKSNSFSVYWFCKILSEYISRIINRK